MAKHINASNGFTLRDLTLQDGVVFEIGNGLENENEEEEYNYSQDVPLTNKEALNLLNMNEFDDVCNNDSPITVCGISFESLKTKMNDMFGKGKIMKLIKQEGVGEIVPYDAQVTIRYMGHLEYRDEPFDSSFARGGSETFYLNEGTLLPGLEIAITTMRKHEVAMFIVHPDLAYGKYGCAPRIPPNEEVLFIVHLVDYVDNGCGRALENLSIHERRQLSNIVKRIQAKFNTAKDCFSKHNIKQAIKEYAKALQWLEEAELRNQEDEDEANKLLSRGYNNLAVCYNIQNNPRQVCNACNKVPTPSAKTHFNYGRALFKMGEYTKAMEKLQNALKMEPNSQETIKEIRLVNDKQRKYLETEKRLWSNCFKGDKKKLDESEFEKVAREMCETFAEDDQILRMPLPECLSPEEEKCIRMHAASLGLSFITNERYGREIAYLAKPYY